VVCLATDFLLIFDPEDKDGIILRNVVSHTELDGAVSQNMAALKDNNLLELYY
jgi:hypothetical protein